MTFFFYKEVIVLLEKSSNIYDSTCSVFREKNLSLFLILICLLFPFLCDRTQFSMNKLKTKELKTAQLSHGVSTIRL